MVEAMACGSVVVVRDESAVRWSRQVM